MFINNQYTLGLSVTCLYIKTFFKKKVTIHITNTYNM